MDLEKVGYDLKAAIENNRLKVPENFSLLAEVLSEHHDEGEYFWLIQDTDSNKYHTISGAHDYTGWDCQSGASVSEPYDTLEAACLMGLPATDNQNRNIRELIEAQVKK